MRINYDPEVDALYMHLLEIQAVESEEIAPDIIVDFSEDGKVVGIEILNVSKHLREISDLSKIKVASAG